MTTAIALAAIGLGYVVAFSLMAINPRDDD
jgi:hypothetical protein